jgi:[ribosomal protein S18]-alanine N-acetyltransferase
VIEIAQLKPSEVALVGRLLPLSRLPRGSSDTSAYLIAWDERRAVGHAHLAWTDTTLGLPEIQDVYVLPRGRRRGVATRLTAAAEALARARGFRCISLSVSRDGNPGARELYAKLGYVDAGIEPVPVKGTIELRDGPLEVDDTLVYLLKAL